MTFWDKKQIAQVKKLAKQLSEHTTTASQLPEIIDQLSELKTMIVQGNNTAITINLDDKEQPFSLYDPNATQGIMRFATKQDLVDAIKQALQISNPDDQVTYKYHGVSKPAAPGGPQIG